MRYTLEYDYFSAVVTRDGEYVSTHLLDPSVDSFLIGHVMGQNVYEFKERCKKAEREDRDSEVHRFEFTDYPIPSVLTDEDSWYELYLSSYHKYVVSYTYGRGGELELCVEHLAPLFNNRIPERLWVRHLP